MERQFVLGARKRPEQLPDSEQRSPLQQVGEGFDWLLPVLLEEPPIRRHSKAGRDGVARFGTRYKHDRGLEPFQVVRGQQPLLTLCRTRDVIHQRKKRREERECRYGMLPGVVASAITSCSFLGSQYLFATSPSAESRSDETRHECKGRAKPDQRKALSELVHGPSLGNHLRALSSAEHRAALDLYVSSSHKRTGLATEGIAPPLKEGLVLGVRRGVYRRVGDPPVRVERAPTDEGSAAGALDAHVQEDGSAPEISLQSRAIHPAVTVSDPALKVRGWRL